MEPTNTWLPQRICRICEPTYNNMIATNVVDAATALLAKQFLECAVYRAHSFHRPASTASQSHGAALKLTTLAYRLISCAHLED